MATTETVEFLFRTRGLEGLAEELDKTAGRADKAERAVEDLRGEVDKLRQSQQRAADSSERMSAGIRGIEGAGRALGGPLGEYAGLLGDLEAVAEGATGALGPAGIAGAFGLLAAVAVPAVIVGTLSALTDLSRASVSARDELEKLGGIDLVTPEALAGIERLETALDRLDVQFSRLLVELAPSLVPVIDMITNAVTRLAMAAAVAGGFLARLDPTKLGEAIGGGAGIALGSLFGGPAMGAVGFEMGSDFGRRLTAPVEAFTPKSRTLRDVVADLVKIGNERESDIDAIKFLTDSRFKFATDQLGMTGQAKDPSIRFDTGARFRLALEELEVAAIEFTGVLGGTFEPLQSLADSAAQVSIELRESLGRAIGQLIGQFGGGESGGARMGQEVVQSLLEEIPIIGGFLSEILAVLLDLPGFLEGLFTFLSEAPEKILVGLARMIGEFPGRLIGEFLPALIAGLIEGLAMLLVSPVALIEGIIRGIGQLPKTLVRELAGLPVRLLSFMDPDENGIFRGPEDRILGIPGTERPDRTPVSAGAPQATGSGGPGRPLPKGGTPAAVAMSTGGSAVLIGGWAEAGDSLGGAMRTRRSFGGGNLGP